MIRDTINGWAENILLEKERGIYKFEIICFFYCGASAGLLAVGIVNALYMLGLTEIYVYLFVPLAGGVLFGGSGIGAFLYGQRLEQSDPND